MPIEDRGAFRTALLVVIGVILVTVELVTAQEAPEPVTWGLLGLGVALCTADAAWGVIDTGEPRDPRG